MIPAEASAKVSFRLVEGQQPDKIRKAFRDYVTARLPGIAAPNLPTIPARRPSRSIGT